MAKHSQFENAKRAAETARMKEIEQAWLKSLPNAEAQAFEDAVAAARARGPQPRPPDMPPGTKPNPPRHEPRPRKDERDRRRA